MSGWFLLIRDLHAAQGASRSHAFVQELFLGMQLFYACIRSEVSQNFHILLNFLTFIVCTMQWLSSGLLWLLFCIPTMAVTLCILVGLIAFPGL